MSSSVKPLADRVLAVKEEVKSKTAAGLYLPDGAKEAATIAVIKAVGPEVKSLKVGDRVLYKPYAESLVEVKVDGTEYLIIKETGVVATVA